MNHWNTTIRLLMDRVNWKCHHVGHLIQSHAGVSRLPRSSDKGLQEAAEHGAQAVAPIASELHFGQMAVAVLGKLDGVVCAGERRLDRQPH